LLWSALVLFKKPLILIVSLYLLLGVGYSLAVPLGESPDEVDHFLYVEYLVTEKRLPVMSPIAAENFTMEANQPPLYYALNAAAAIWFPAAPSADLPLNACYSFDPADNGRATFYRHSPAEKFPGSGMLAAFQLARFISIIMGAGTILLAYRLGRRLYPGKPQVALMGAALLAFNPQFIFITASVNNDVLMALLGAAIVVMAVETAVADFVSPQRLRRYAFWSGLLVGLGLLTKYALFAFWPLALLAVVWRVIRLEKQRPSPFTMRAFVQTGLIPVALVLAPPLLLAGWWYGRAWFLYGDPLIWDVHLAAKGEQVLRQGPVTLTDLWEFAAVHFQSYWLWLGWLKIKASVWVYGLLALMVFAALIGLPSLLARSGKLLWQRWGEDRLTQDGVNGAALWLMALAVTAVYAALFRYILTINWSGYQGRLAFAAAAPIAVLLGVGLQQMAVRYKTARWLPSVAVAGLFTLACLSLPLLILPAYPRPTIYQPDPAALEGQPCVRLAGSLEIEGITAVPAARPGDTMAFSLYAYGLAPAVNQRLAARVVGANGDIVGQAEQTLSWDRGRPLTIPWQIPVTREAQPARAVIEVGLLDEGGEWLAATTVSGHPLPAPVGVAAAKIGPGNEAPPMPETAVWVPFDQQLALIGFDLVQNEEKAALTLYWQALAVMPDDYTIFVHLLDSEGRLIAQHDDQPQGGVYPTSIWDVGEWVADSVTLTWLPSAPLGPYRVAVGVYLLATMERLPAGQVSETTNLFYLPALIRP
jgi:hypothetical protein